MKTTVNESDFRTAFYNIRKENFTYEGLGILFESLEQYEEETGEEIELDVIALCCEYSEDDLEEVLKNYELDSLDELNDKTLVLGVTSANTVVYQIF